MRIPIQKILLFTLFLIFPFSSYSVKFEFSKKKKDLTKELILFLKEINSLWMGKKLADFNNNTQRALLSGEQMITMLESAKSKFKGRVDMNAEEILKHFFSAVNSENIALIKFLIEYGVNVNNDHPFNVPMLTYAVLRKNTKIVRIFIESGADVNKTPGYYFERGGGFEKYKCSLVHMAVFNNDLEMLKLLVAMGAGFRELDCDGRQPIDIASQVQIKEYLQFADKIIGKIACSNSKEIYGTSSCCDEKNIADLWPLLPWKSTHFFEWHLKHNADLLEKFLTASDRLKEGNFGTKWIYFALAKELFWNFENIRRGLDGCFSSFQFSHNPDEYEGAVLAFIKTLKFNREQNDAINKDKAVWLQKKKLFSHVAVKNFNSMPNLGDSKLIDLKFTFAH